MEMISDGTSAMNEDALGQRRKVSEIYLLKNSIVKINNSFCRLIRFGLVNLFSKDFSLGNICASFFFVDLSHR